MKTLMLTTVLALTMAAGVGAQTAPPPAAPGAEISGDTTPGHAAMVPGFRASDFTGMALYTLDPEVVTELRATRPVDPAWDTRSSRWTSGETFVAGRDRWENIGSINDIVLSQDGEVRGVLLDVGGFLGIGARTVMVGIDDLYFVADSETSDDLSDFFVVASLSRAQLESLPEWSDDNLAVGYSYDQGVMDGAPDTMPTAEETASPEARSGMVDTAMTPTAEELMGAEVHDVAGTSIGRVNDLVLDGDTVSQALIDVGGFLGIGSRTVAVPVESLVIVRDADQSVLRVETTMVRAQIEALPEHGG